LGAKLQQRGRSKGVGPKKGAPLKREVRRNQKNEKEYGPFRGGGTLDQKVVLLNGKYCCLHEAENDKMGGEERGARRGVKPVDTALQTRNMKFRSGRV